MQLLKRLPVILYWKALVRLIDRKSWIACGKAFHRSSRATNSFNGRLIRHRSGAGGFSLFFSFSFLVWGGKTSVDDTFALGFRPSSAGISSWTQRANAIRNPSSCFSGCSCRSMPLPFGMAGVKWKKWTLSLSFVPAWICDGWRSRWFLTEQEKESSKRPATHPTISLCARMRTISLG